MNTAGHCRSPAQRLSGLGDHCFLSMPNTVPFFGGCLHPLGICLFPGRKIFDFLYSLTAGGRVLPDCALSIPRGGSWSASLSQRAGHGHLSSTRLSLAMVPVLETTIVYLPRSICVYLSALQLHTVAEAFVSCLHNCLTT